MTLRKKVLTTAMLVATTAAASASGTPAAPLTEVQLVEDTGASERVENAALLRVLSQETASAACHMAHNVSPTTSRTLMLKVKTKFDVILDALQHGNEDMNIIGAEERSTTILQIKDLRSKWRPMFDAAVALLEDPGAEGALEVIKADNEAVLAATMLLTSQIAGQYANPVELSQADVMMIDFAARQGMWTQKMAKTACEIWAGNRSEDRTATLTKTMGTYETTLGALLNGMPAVGLRGAPTPQIKAALEDATENWTATKAELEIVLAGGDVSQDVRESLYQNLNAAMYEMEHIASLYSTYSKYLDETNEEPA